MTRMLYAPPPAPASVAELTLSYQYVILGELAPGRLGACCACQGITSSWWSPAPPSGYVPLHEGCTGRLVARWLGGEEEAEPEPEPLRSQRGRGMYGRIRTTAQYPAPAEAVEAPVYRADSGAALPPGFAPGPFWQPGDDAHSPWTVLLETATGHSVTPCARDRARAMKVLSLSESTGRTSSGVAVVGGAVFAPDGEAVASWGSVPTPGASRWAPVYRLSTWQRCTGCGELRWPGCWITVTEARCQGCQRAAEVADPRPWPDDPARPDDRYIPEHHTKTKRVTPPAIAKRPVRVLRSRRKSG